MITRNLLTRSYKLLLTLLVLLMSTNAFAQRLTATGKVTDAAGLEVIGALSGRNIS
jgi:TonB-dependent starch-binding outer membrane protein SusC